MSGVELQTERLIVRTPRPGDGRAYASYYRTNQAFLQPLSPTFTPEMFSAADWERSIPIIAQQFAQGLAIRFCLFAQDELVGVANVSDVKKSPLYSCVLGYTLGERHQGQGLMPEALRAIIPFLFEQWRIHRIAANYMPRNERSGRLLRRLGFKVEGYARDFMLIDGRWEDHVLAALTNECWRPG